MNTKTKKIRVLNDFAFKKVFGEKGDEVQLISLLNSILKLTGKYRIVSIEIVESKELPADFLGGKASKLDVRVSQRYAWSLRLANRVAVCSKLPSSSRLRLEPCRNTFIAMIDEE